MSPAERHRLAEAVEARLDPAMSALGVIFALIVLIETISRPVGPLGTAMGVVGWILWAIFVVELSARAAIAPSKTAFFRRNWWQVLFLLLPFLRVLRLMGAARVARAGRVLSSSVRASRGAGHALRGRVGWLLSLTVILILGSSQILFEFGEFDTYADALYGSALAAITGNGLEGEGGVSRAFSLALAIYSVVIFASLAAILGAYFMGEGGTTHGRRHAGEEQRSRLPDR